MTAISFYKGSVTHRRHSKVSHKLRYRIAYILLDLDRLDEAGSASRFLGVERAGLLSFRARDHGDGNTNDLATWVRSYLRRQDVDEDAARIELMALPRMFGFVFNPIAVYFIYDREDNLHHILYQVTSTFSQRHFYLCRAEQAGPVISQTSDKRLYVSPFFDVEGNYHFKVQPPADRFALTIRYDHATGEKALTACLAGLRTPVSSWETIKVLIGFPLMTIGVVVGIHWHALKLWLKGARYRSRAAAHGEHSPAGIHS